MGPQQRRGCIDVAYQVERHGLLLIGWALGLTPGAPIRAMGKGAPSEPGRIQHFPRPDLSDALGLEAMDISRAGFLAALDLPHDGQVTRVGFGPAGAAELKLPCPRPLAILPLPEAQDLCRQGEFGAAPYPGSPQERVAHWHSLTLPPAADPTYPMIRHDGLSRSHLAYAQTPTQAQQALDGLLLQGAAPHSDLVILGFPFDPVTFERIACSLSSIFPYSLLLLSCPQSAFAPQARIAARAHGLPAPL